MLRIENINKQFGDLHVLKNIQASIESGQIIAILGPSGCGKTTLLQILAGLIPQDSGHLEGFDGQRSYVFQESRLIPWQTATQNVAFVLREKLPETEISNIIATNLELVELTDFAHYYPRKMSGGMQHRVAIARALAVSSPLLFFDEPFQSLDFDLKHRLIIKLLPLWTTKNTTVIMVTHDVHVAACLADRVYFMSHKPSSIAHIMDNPVNREQRIGGFQLEQTQFEDHIYQFLTKQAK